ncbi:LysR substrate-binding domain-containing protein, partial [Mesorhizobium japonicum]|uniref:LysR substrate-binding domain-containing protein n=1 Tax=Mesorhizobium japonicum TaxID=2066070 RepID=UPI003B5BCCA7
MLEIDEVEDWLDLIAAGAAVGVTSAATLEHQPRGDLRAVPISDAPELPVALAWPSGHRTPAVDELAELLRGLYAAGGGG